MALPEFTAIAELEFPELHDESIPTLTFAKAVQRLLAASGVRDFMLKVRRAAEWLASRKCRNDAWPHVRGHADRLHEAAHQLCCSAGR